MTTPTRTKLEVRDHLLRVLSKAQKERKKRQDMVQDTDSPYSKENPGWVLFERRTMLDEVNRLRAEKGQTPVTPRDIIKVENQALGHSDYSSKFALYCAEISLGKDANHVLP